MESASARLNQDGLYNDAVKSYGPVLDRLARGYEADPEKRRDLLQEIHLQLMANRTVVLILVAKQKKMRTKEQQLIAAGLPEK